MEAYYFMNMMNSMYSELDQHIADDNVAEATRVFAMIREIRLTKLGE